MMSLVGLEVWNCALAKISLVVAIETHTVQLQPNQLAHSGERERTRRVRIVVKEIDWRWCLADLTAAEA